jgi:hypothetical protein
LSPAKTVKGISAMSVPETCGVPSHYGIGCHADSSDGVDGSAHALVLPGGEREADVELRGGRDERLGVEPAVRPHGELSAAPALHAADRLGQERRRTTGAPALPLRSRHISTCPV